MNQDQYPLEKLFGRILSPFEAFLQRTTAGGIVLIGTTILALIIANLPGGSTFYHFWEQPLIIGIGIYHLDMSIHHFVNDGLMTLFFLLVGLELKRELMVGELSSLKDAALPVIAAFGGVLIPALIYHFHNPSGDAAFGWGIPTATDIAFAVGILVLLSWRIPRNLIIFLAALAIADDLVAILIIAVFYSKTLNIISLIYALFFFMTLVLFNRGGIRYNLPYGIIGFALWLALLKSGIHATLAGVILAFTIPAKPEIKPDQLYRRLEELEFTLYNKSEQLDSTYEPLSNQRMAITAHNLEQTAQKCQSPQQRLEHVLTPIVTFVVIPLFALVNAGLSFSGIRFEDSVLHPVTIGVVLGLVLGKFLGISGASFLALRLGFARLPAGVNMLHICGVAWLGGIGFTMSIFISQLAFIGRPDFIENAKIGILLGSFISAVIGTVWLFFSTRQIRINQ
jgi:Na+:H+ antiporter, NhaA family